MIRIGITGHQKLEKLHHWIWLEDCLRTLLNNYESIFGITSLAVGSDQLFAKLIIEKNDLLHVVVPFPDYEFKFESIKMLNIYHSYLKKAFKIDTLVFQNSVEQSYLNAGQYIANISEKMIAIWNGKAAAGLGGTGDIVKYCYQIKKNIIHINPYKKTIIEINA
jgi:hypothetical protein